MSDKSEMLVQAKKISALKGHLTRLLNAIQSSLNRENVENEEILELQERMCDKRDVLIDLIYDYLSKDDGEDLKDRKNEIRQIETRVDRLNEEINSFLAVSMKRSDMVVSTFERDYVLEKMSLPKFNGKDYFHWKPIFDTVVDSQKWPEKEKLLRLLSCLEGEPKSLIKNYPIVDASYTKCLSRLEETFGGEQRLILDAIQQVRLGRTIDSECLQDVRSFICTLESAQVTLRDKDCTSASSLYQAAKERLDETLRRRYIDNVISNNLCESFTSLIDFLSQWSKIIEYAPKQNYKRYKPSMLSHNQNLSYRSDKAKSDVSKTNFIPYCQWHFKVKNRQEKHYLDRCPEFKNLTVKEKRDFVFTNRLCKICLKKNHFARNCVNTKTLCRKCKTDKHHFILHENRIETAIEPIVQEQPLEINECDLNNNNSVISLQTVPVLVSNPLDDKLKMKVNCLLDTGSNCSFISQRVVKCLGLEEFDCETRTLNTINSTNNFFDVSKVKVTLGNVNNKSKRNEVFFSAPKMLLKSKITAWKDYKDSWPHLRSIKLPELAKFSTHDLLIGMDKPKYHLSKQELISTANAPVAKLSELGWSIFGPLRQQDKEEESDISCLYLETNLMQEVTNLWNLESLGIKNPINEPYLPSSEELKATEMLSSQLEYKDKRYYAPILWKTESPQGNNYDDVFRRMKAIENRLAQKTNVVQQCDEIIQNYLIKDYIKFIPDSQRYENCFYIPLFPIQNEQRQTTKTRLVFDCSAKFNGSSLNDRILQSVKLQNDIVDILLRFRKYQFAIIADISEMYLTIGLKDQDCRFCRFLWKERIYEWRRTIFGRKDSPNIALYTVAFHAKKFTERYPQTVNIILNSMYVDDLVCSLRTEQDVIRLSHEATEIFSQASMTLHKFCSNSRLALQSVPIELRAKNEQSFDKDTNISKMLGLYWNSSEDSLSFSVKEHQLDKCLTKRKILKILAQTYDPLGLISPYLVTGKIIFQRVWTETKGWDIPVSQSIKSDWEKWYSQLHELKSISVPRHIGILDNNYEIHVFSDASKSAFASTLYVKTAIDVRLLLAKSRITPLKAISLPRLELTAAVIGCRLACKVCKNFDKDIKEVIFWTDAMDVIHWLRQASKFFKPYVSNRVGEIQSVTTIEQWHYCPSKQNPADLPSRGVSVKDLKSSDLWWHGPNFLKLEKEEWPIETGSSKGSREEDSFKNENEKNIGAVISDIFNCQLSEEFSEKSTAGVKREIMSSDFGLHPSRWSNFMKLKRRTAYVCRFMDRCRRKEKVGEGKHLDPSEIIRARDKLIFICQQEAFPEEIAQIRKSNSVSKSSHLSKLTPFIDNSGLIRSKTRLQNLSWLTYEFKFPLILPKAHCLSLLIIRTAHEDYGHPLGLTATLNELNKRFWIIGQRPMLKRVQHKCMKCRIERSKPTQPIMGDLPSFRFKKPWRAFNKTSVDFAGPFYTKASKRGMSRNKRYVALFTCLQIRAVHLEMTYSLETGSFLNAFSRFCDRRGTPQIMVSDNAGCFLRAEKQLRAQMLQQKDKILETNRQVKWQFLPPYASNFAGVHEILVRSMKRALRHILGDANVSDEELFTALVQAESLMNSRPITVCDDDVSSDPCLTPNHFLFGRAEPGNILADVEENDGQLLSRRYKLVQSLIEQVWVRWQKEVLHNCKTRTKWKVKTPNLKVDDVVICLEPIQLKKHNWKLGRVINTFPGLDNVVRVVDVLIEGKTYRRPVSKLCMLDC